MHKNFYRNRGVVFLGLLLWLTAGSLTPLHALQNPLTNTSDYFSSVMVVPGIKHDQTALTADEYKLYSPDGGTNFKRYDLLNDSEERNNIALDYPGITEDLKKKLEDGLREIEQDCLVSTTISN